MHTKLVYKYYIFPVPLGFDAQTFTQLPLQPSSADSLLKPHPLIYSRPHALCGCAELNYVAVAILAVLK